MRQTGEFSQSSYRVPVSPSQFTAAGRSYVRTVLLGATVLTVAGAGFVYHYSETVPVSGRRRVLRLPHAWEMTVGETLFGEEVKEHEHLDKLLPPTAPEVDQVQRVLERLVKAYQQWPGALDYRWEVVVVRDPIPNACCFPGGKILINSGLFGLLRKAQRIAQHPECALAELELELEQLAEGEQGHLPDHLLATVLSHEMSHAIAHHPSEALLEHGAAMLAIGGTLYALFGSLSSSVIQTIAEISVLPFSRRRESEADRIGVALMQAAGYDPKSALDYWSHVLTIHGRGHKVAGYFSTHPTHQQRLVDLKSVIDELVPNDEATSPQSC